MENEIAAWLGVSRTPVRHAVQRLTSESILEGDPSKGLVVAKLDLQAVMELYVIRETLEGTAARLCALHASDMEIVRLVNLIETEKELQGQLDALPDHDQLFHQAIHRGAGNRCLAKTLVSITDLGLLGGSLMSTPHRTKVAVKEHFEIVRAIGSRNIEAAEEAARCHVRSALQERLKLMF